MTTARWIRPVTVAIVACGVIAASLPMNTLARDPAYIGGTTAAPAYDVADCSSNIGDGFVRYFVSVRDAVTTADITTATGQLTYVGPYPYPFGFPPTITMTNGDLESQANDGTPPSCTAATNDGRANDLGSSAIPASPNYGWTLVVSLTGYTSQTIALSSFTDGVGACPMGDGRGCLIALGTVSLNPVGAATATPTTTPGASSGPGGRGFAVQSAASGQVILTWASGTGQDGYALLRILASGASVPQVFGPGYTSYTDIMPVGEAAACYQLIVRLTSTTTPAKSDLLCVIRGIESGVAAPRDMGVQLNQSTTATVRWTAPAASTFTGYIFVPLGTTRAPQALNTNAITVADNTGGAATCYAVVSINGTSFAGVGNLVCAVPGQSSGL